MGGGRNGGIIERAEPMRLLAESSREVEGSYGQVDEEFDGMRGWRRSIFGE